MATFQITSSVRNYVKTLKKYTVVDKNNKAQTRAENFKEMIEYVEGIAERKKKEAQRVQLYYLNKQNKIKHIRDQLIKKFEDDGLDYTHTLFRETAQMMLNVSSDMEDVVGAINYTGDSERSNLRKYKKEYVIIEQALREIGEIIVVYNEFISGMTDLKNLLSE